VEVAALAQFRPGFLAFRMWRRRRNVIEVRHDEAQAALQPTQLIRERAGR